MMQQSHLTAWQAYASWPKRSQIEQDLRLSRGVAAIFADPTLAPPFLIPLSACEPGPSSSRLRVIAFREGDARNYRPSTDKSGCVPSMIDRPSANPACSAASAFGRSGIA
jgi:hypothetical protein